MKPNLSFRIDEKLKQALQECAEKHAKEAGVPVSVSAYVVKVLREHVGKKALK